MSALKSDYFYHVKMLADKTRLVAYREALRESVKQGECIVEVGSGTGVLSLIAASLGAKRVDAVEYFGDLCELSKKNAGASSGLQPHFHQNSSYAWEPEAPVAGLFSETIGLWGPEENTVEIFADFVSRNPGTRWLVPSKLTLLAQEIKAQAIVLGYEAISDACSTAAEISGRDFQVVEAELSGYYTSNIQSTSLTHSEVEKLSDARIVKEYALGQDITSRFETEMTLESPDANGLHLWFEASLSKNVTLSSHFEQPSTHWQHLVLPRPEGKCKVRISYKPEARAFSFLWV